MRATRVGLVALSGVLASLVMGAGTASAGGANWSFDGESYEVGDVAHGVTGISWGHNPSLGTPEDGPYFVYLSNADVSRSWPQPTSTDLRVGVVEIVRGPVEQFPGFFVGPDGAKVTFTVPDLPAGRYSVLHCNDPCTTTLADITFGFITVGSVSAEEEPGADVAVEAPSAVVERIDHVAPVTNDQPGLVTAAPVDTDRDADIPPLALAGLVAAPAALLAWRLGARRRAHAASGRRR